MELQQLLERQSARRRARRRKLRPPTPSKQTEVWYRDQLSALIGLWQGQLIQTLSHLPLNDAPNTPTMPLTARFSYALQTLAQLKISDIARRITFGMIRRATMRRIKVRRRRPIKMRSVLT